MLILTPAESAAHRVAYMHSLAMSLLGGNPAHWRSATDEERAEVKGFLTRAHIKFPNEKGLAIREGAIAADRKRAAAAAARREKPAGKSKRRTTAPVGEDPKSK
jgi:hypothetical protein